MINDDIIYPGYEYKRNKDNKIILPSIEEQRGKHTTECKKTLVVFIGGASDDWRQPLLKSVFAPYEKAYGRGNNRRQDIAYSESGVKHVPSLMQKWAKANQKIVLVGHSWGGDSVIRLAENKENSNIPIKLLVTLDPVSLRKNGNQSKPKTVERWVNVYVDYNLADWSFPNIIARAGGKWGVCYKADKNVAINLLIKDTGHGDADDMFYKTGVANEVLKL